MFPSLASMVNVMILSIKCPICKAPISEYCNGKIKPETYYERYGVHKVRYFQNPKSFKKN